MGLIVSALLLFAGFLGMFNSFRVIAQTSCLRASPNLYLISPGMDLLVIFTCLLAAWVIAFMQKNVFAFDYVGTRFYGRKQTDQGYITTKWLVFGFPLLPIRSYLVDSPSKEISCLKLEFQNNPMRAIEGYFYLPQVLRTAFISYGTLLWCWGCLWLMLNSSCL
jgi:hypothetical protein